MNRPVFPPLDSRVRPIDPDGPVDAIVRLLRQKQPEEQECSPRQINSGRQSEPWNLRWYDAYGISHAVLWSKGQRRTRCGIKIAVDTELCDEEVTSCPRCFARAFLPTPTQGI